MRLTNNTNHSDAHVLKEIEELWPNFKLSKMSEFRIKEKDGLRFCPGVNADEMALFAMEVHEMQFQTPWEAFLATFKKKNYDGLINHQGRCACTPDVAKHCKDFCWDRCKYAWEFDGVFKEFSDDSRGYVPWKKTKGGVNVQ